MTSCIFCVGWKRFIELIEIMNSLIFNSVLEHANIKIEAHLLKVMLSCCQARWLFYGNWIRQTTGFLIGKILFVRRLERTRLCILLHCSSTSVSIVQHSQKKQFKNSLNSIDWSILAAHLEILVYLDDFKQFWEALKQNVCVKCSHQIINFMI